MLDYIKELETTSFIKAVTRIFTPYQISIIIHKAKHLTLSKTDIEVYSRIVKKKLVALSDDNLFKIAKQVLRDR